MWSKNTRPQPAASGLRTGPAAEQAASAARVAASPVRPSRVLQSSRAPQQLCFEFKRG